MVALIVFFVVALLVFFVMALIVSFFVMALLVSFFVVALLVLFFAVALLVSFLVGYLTVVLCDSWCITYQTKVRVPHNVSFGQAPIGQRHVWSLGSSQHRPLFCWS